MVGKKEQGEKKWDYDRHKGSRRQEKENELSRVKVFKIRRC